MLHKISQVCAPRVAHGEYEVAKAEMKALVSEDAWEAAGHGVRAKRSDSGAIAFEAVEVENADAAVP
ncbi:hypothetical protein [Bradyrhizobium sp. USDA 4454]